MKIQLLFVRHGEADHNVGEQHFSGLATNHYRRMSLSPQKDKTLKEYVTDTVLRSLHHAGGETYIDPHLTKKGQAQATLAGKNLEEHGVFGTSPVFAVSPLHRPLETFMGATPEGTQGIILPELREVCGGERFADKCIGLKGKETKYAERLDFSRLQGVKEADLWGEKREGKTEVAERVLAGISGLAKDQKFQHGQTLVAVTHAGVITRTVEALTGTAIDKPGNCDIIKLSLELDDADYRIKNVIGEPELLKSAAELEGEFEKRTFGESHWDTLRTEVLGHAFDRASFQRRASERSLTVMRDRSSRSVSPNPLRRQNEEGDNGSRVRRRSSVEGQGTPLKMK